MGVGFPPVGAPAIVRLVSAGAEPRIALRYKVPVGFKGKMDMSVSTSMRMELGGTTMPDLAMPKMSSLLEMAVTAVSPSGDMSIRAESATLKMDMTGVDPMVATAMQAADFGNTSVVVTGVTDPRGLARDMVSDTSKITNPQLKAMAEQVAESVKTASFQLPEEAVGVGAKWEVRSHMATGGIDGFQTALFEIVAIEGRKVRLKVNITQTAPPQAADIPNMPPGAAAQLRELTGTGSGTAVVDLDSLIAEGEQSL